MLQKNPSKIPRNLKLQLFYFIEEKLLNSVFQFRNQTSEEILFSTDNYLAGVIVTLLCALSGAFSYVTSALIK